MIYQGAMRSIVAASSQRAMRSAVIHDTEPRSAEIHAPSPPNTALIKA
ncbi:hypothetical protein ACVOMV_10315 [Mesorhizobium atlanticum]